MEGSQPRTEEVVTDKTSVTTTFSDGTIRRDSRILPAEKPALVTVETPAVWTEEDMRRMRDSTWMRVQAGGVITEKQLAAAGGRVVRAAGYESGFDNR